VQKYFNMTLGMFIFWTTIVAIFLVIGLYWKLGKCKERKIKKGE